MLGHAIRGEIQDLATMVQSVGDEKYRYVLALCATAAVYVAADASERWPTDADIYDTVRVVASGETMYELKQDGRSALLALRVRTHMLQAAEEREA
jgi:hypothetical protein